MGCFSLGAASVVVAAQRGAVAPSMGHAMAPAPTVGAHAASPMHGAPPVAHGAPVHAGTHGAPGARAVTTSHRPMSGEPVTSQPRNTNGHPFYPYPTNLLPGVSDNFASGYPVPGLGFDYAHFFAVHPNWGRLHPVDGVLLSWGGSYMSEPVPEFVFVKHDGSTFSAVAYTWTKDKLQYFTKEGLRRTTGIDTLDLAATERLNEERGNCVNLPKRLASSEALQIDPAPLR